MRTFLIRPICFVTLLVICLMFAPARLVTGDRQAMPMPANFDLELSAGDPQNRTFAELCEDDPIAAVSMSLLRYKQEIEGYSCEMLKHERIDGKLNKLERMQCDFRESPFSVRMEWLEGMGRAWRLLYPAEGRRDRLAVVPANPKARIIVPYATRSLDDAEVRAQSRYPVTQFGMYAGLVRAQTAMIAARDRGLLKTRYEGIKPIAELGGKPCHVLHRDSEIPEEDGQTHLVLYFDPDTLLQVGAIVHAGDDLVASYLFKNVVVNPKFEADWFTIEKLK